MNNYEGYIHAGGAVMVLKIPEFGSTLDRNSFNVLKYLGETRQPSLNMAKKYFYKLNGGKKYLDQEEIKKLDRERKQ